MTPDSWARKVEDIAAECARGGFSFEVALRTFRRDGTPFFMRKAA